MRRNENFETPLRECQQRRIFKFIQMKVKLDCKCKYEEIFEFVSIVFRKLKSNFERCFFLIAKFLRRMEDRI